MEENIINEQQNDQINAQGGAPKKKVRKGLVFFSLVPFAVLLMVQTISQVPFYTLAVVDVINEGYSADDAYGFIMALNNTLNEKYLVFLYIVYAVLGITIFGIWYYKGYVKKHPKVKLGEVFGVKSVSASVLTAASLYFVINAAAILTNWLFPKVMEEYNELIEMSGLVNNAVILIAYSLIMAPILEELVFRGVIFGVLEDSGIRPGLRILFTTILFSVMHITIPIQMVYAFLVGLMLGFLRYKYRSIRISILTHMLFNFIGTFVSGIIDNSGLGEGAMLIFGGIALIVMVFVIVLVKGDKKAYKPAGKSQEDLTDVAG